VNRLSCRVLSCPVVSCRVLSSPRLGEGRAWVAARRCARVAAWLQAWEAWRGLLHQQAVLWFTRRVRGRLAALETRSRWCKGKFGPRCTRTFDGVQRKVRGYSEPPSVWRLALAAEVSVEKGLVATRVSRGTIRTTWLRLTALICDLLCRVL
jgi:hypothetical protein